MKAACASGLCCHLERTAERALGRSAHSSVVWLGWHGTRMMVMRACDVQGLAGASGSSQRI